MKNDEVIEIFKKTGALLEGHFILTSGYHSPHYFQCAKVLQYPKYLSLFSSEIANHFSNIKFDVVVSPAIGGIVLGTEVGRQLNTKTIFTERIYGKMSLRRGFEINEGDKVLIVEDVVTTGGSVMEIIEILKTKNAVPSAVAFIIDRSKGKVNFGIPQHSLASFDVIKFKETEIPDWLSKIPVSKPGSRDF